MVEKNVDATVDQLAQAFHAAQCVNRLTPRHSWTEHRALAIRVCEYAGLAGIGRRVELAFKQGFDSRSDHFRKLESQLATLDRQNVELRADLAKAEGQRHESAVRIVELERVLSAERETCNAAQAEAEADRRALVDEKRQRMQAEDQARAINLELRDVTKALAAATAENAALQISRRHTADALQAAATTTGEGATA